MNTTTIETTSVFQRPNPTLKTWFSELVSMEDDPDSFLRDLACHGCASGIVGSLIYYSDCIAFYDQFEGDIWELVEDYLDGTGLSLLDFMAGFSQPVVGLLFLKTMFSWFAVELLAGQWIENGPLFLESAHG